MTPTSGRRRFALLLPAALLLLLPRGARAQACSDTTAVPDFPFLSESGLWARTAAMGDAQVAVGADAAALHANPAGLALVRRVEAAGSLRAASVDAGLTSFGTARDATISGTTLSALSLTYPFPVYRGSLVVAAAFERPIDFDLHTVRAGTRPDPGGDVTFEDRVSETGSVSMYRLGAAVDVARAVSVGGSAFLVGGGDHRLRTSSTGRVGSDTTVVTSDQDLAVRGYGAVLGALFRVSPYARLGAAVELPRHLSFKGTVDGDRVENTFRLPFFLSLGLAVTPPSVILAADVVFADWRELEDDVGRFTYCDDSAYRGTTDVRLGAEVRVPRTLLRLRGGWRSTPLALEFLPDLSRDDSGFAPVETVQDRRAVSLGAGYLVAEAFTLDVGWVRETFHRQSRDAAPSPSGPGIDEERTTRRLFASVAFRL